MQLRRPARNLRGVDDDTGEADEGGEGVGGKISELKEVHPGPYRDLHGGDGVLLRISGGCRVEQRLGQPGQGAFELGSAATGTTQGCTHQRHHLAWLLLHLLSELLVPYPQIPQVHLQAVVVKQQTRA